MIKHRDYAVLQLPSLTRDAIFRAVQEPVSRPKRMQSGSAPQASADPAAIADAILAGLRAGPWEGQRRGSQEGAGSLATLPLNLGGLGIVAYLATVTEGFRCSALEPVAAGHFVFGSDHEIFGRWNALVAARSVPSCDVFPAHGGEIIPGTLEDHITRIRENLTQNTRLPVQVDIDVSMACPSSCVFCFSAGYRASRATGRVMQAQLLLRLIGQWADLGVKVIRFDGGGDPLTHPNLLQAIDLCRDLGLRTAVLTAGDLLAQRHISTFVRGRTYVRVSLNAASDETRRELHRRQGERYGVAHIFDAVSLLAAARDDAFGHESSTVMPIGATSMIHPVNVKETVSIAKRAKSAGFDHLSFRVILGADHRVAFTDAERAALDAAFDEIHRSVADRHFQVFVPTRDVTDQGYVPARYFQECRACTHRALVEVGPAADRAAIVPCGRYRGHGYRHGDDQNRMVFGYLSDRTAVADVWLQPSMKKLAGSFPQRCADCIDRSANIFLETMETILRDDPQAVFYPFATTGHAGGNENA